MLTLAVLQSHFSNLLLPRPKKSALRPSYSTVWTPVAKNQL